MAISPESAERLKKLARVGVPLVGAAAVRYVYKNGIPEGYVYKLEKSKSYMIGALNTAKGKLAEVSGSYGPHGISIDQEEFDEADVSELERVVEIMRDE